MLAPGFYHYCDTHADAEPQQLVPTLVHPDPEHDDAHTLMPDWLAADIPDLYSQERVRDPLICARFVTPDASWAWYVLEYSPAQRLCFGLVDGHEQQELRFFSLPELEEVRGPRGFHIERDLSFQPCRLSTVRGC